MKLNQLICIFCFILSSQAFGQDTVSLGWKGMYYITDSNYGDLIGDCIFCNPEIMRDRILLDSTKTIISRKRSNVIGFTYYEWLGNYHCKSQEHVYVKGLQCLTTVFYIDSCHAIEQLDNCGQPVNIARYHENNLQTIQRIEISLDSTQLDSLLNTIKVTNFQRRIRSGYFKQIDFYESGVVESIGYILRIDPEDETKDIKVGLWQYYDINGNSSNSKKFMTRKK